MTPSINLDLDLPVFPPDFDLPPPILTPEQYLEFLEEARQLQLRAAFEAWLADPKSLPSGAPFVMHD